MSSQQAAAPVKWAAQLAHVREVSLFGTADYAFWKGLLAKEGLTPADHGGKARLLVLAADSKYLGIPFREVSVSVLVREREPAAAADGAFLAHAFNTSRLFAFLERLCFATPYYHAQIDVQVGPPAAIRVRAAGEVVFAAEMGPTSPAPSRSGGRGGRGRCFCRAPTRRGTAPASSSWRRSAA
jgi:hypothetical protein